MKLLLVRSQKQHGVVSKNVTFCLNARAELTAEEAANVKKYKLGKETIYNSAASKRHLDKAIENSYSRKLFDVIKSVGNMAMSKLSLNITIDSLTKGQYIEAKSLQELLDAEETIRQACRNLQTHLAIAATFDGQEEIVEF